MKERISKFLKRIIPRTVKCSLRTIYIMQFLRGQSKTSKDGFCIDAYGNAIPWITYPAIDYLNRLSLANASVFEYGAGSSTRWWSLKAKSVKCVEMNRAWFEKVEKLKLPNVTIQLCEDGAKYPSIIQTHNEQFDIVMIDGAERYRSAMNAIQKLKQNGLVILDNTEWYPNTAKFLRSEGFTQIDFYGFTPVNSFPSVTSIFFKPDCELLKKIVFEEIDVIGGVILKDGALDDNP
jgi:hypothetical protein